jgi:hypothetical protein
MTDDHAAPRLLRVDTRHGVFHAVADDLITRQLLDFGAHTRNELAMVLDHVSQGAVFFPLPASWARAANFSPSRALQKPSACWSEMSAPMV